MSYYSEKHYWEVQDGKFGFLCDIDVKCSFCDAYHTIKDNVIKQDWDGDYIDELYFKDVEGYVCCDDCAEIIEKRKWNIDIIVFDELSGKELFDWEYYYYGKED